MTESSSDRIEKEIVVRAPRSRVWKAITDSREFGSWFRVEMHDPFVVGRRARGKILYPGYEHLTMEVEVERMEPERVFAVRWHPNATDVGRDYSGEPATLVVFELDEVPGGTRVRVTESGFDQIPLDRRAEAYRGNSRGWEIQLENIAKHVAPPS